MSNPDSFIDEVTEEVQRDKLFRLFRRYGWIAVLLIILLVGGAAAFEWRRATIEARAQALGDSLLNALEAEEGDARADAIAGIEASPEAAAMVGLLQAAERLSSEDPEAAAAALRAVSDNPNASALYRDLAALKLVMIAQSGLSDDERNEILNRLATPGAPFRHLAIEQQVYTAVQAGDRDGALQAARDLLQENELTPGVAERLTNLILALGETPISE